MPWLKQFAMYNHISKTNYYRETTSMMELSTTLQKAKRLSLTKPPGRLCDLYIVSWTINSVDPSLSLIIAPILLNGNPLSFHLSKPEAHTICLIYQTLYPLSYQASLNTFTPPISPKASLLPSLTHSNGTFLKHQVVLTLLIISQ